MIREPLLHFALLGAALFALHRWMSPVSAGAPDRIVVTAGQVESLATTFARVWQRAPTARELRDLVDDHVEEEVLSREAVALGLDRDDTVVRRRLRQKMEFLIEDAATTAEPSEAELEAWLREHTEDFVEGTRSSFRHVYLGEDDGETVAAEAARLLSLLRAPGVDARTTDLGRRLLLPMEFTLEPSSGVAGLLGDGFAAALDQLAVGEWTGPIASSYGLHLVLVTERREGRPPELTEVRDAVRRALLAARRERAGREFVESLLERYDVTVEWDSVAGAPVHGAATDG